MAQTDILAASTDEAAVDPVALLDPEDGVAVRSLEECGPLHATVGRSACLVVAGRRPDGGWRRTVARVRRLGLGLPVVFVTRDGGDRLAARAVEFGVDRYLCLEAVTDSAERVRAAVERVADDVDAGPPERYRTLVEAAGDPMYMLDAAGRLLLRNEALVERLGYEESLLGERPRRYLSAADLERADELVADLLAEGGGHATIEVDVHPEDGDPVPCEVSLAPVLVDGTFVGSVGVVRDVTERTRRRERLERQNERLDRFASVVSHDLRNPLEVALTRIDLARERGDDAHLDGAVDALERIDDIVENLLTLARQGTAVEDTGAVSLETTARAAWELVETGDASIEVAGDATVRAGRTRLQQLFENLFRNALEHAGPDVTVTVGTLEDDRAGFYVADDGPGIPPTERDRVLEYGEAGEDGGTGLGLAIVAEIVEAHDWRVDIRESGSGGARFEVSGVTLGGE